MPTPSTPAHPMPEPSLEPARSAERSHRLAMALMGLACLVSVGSSLVAAWAIRDAFEAMDRAAAAMVEAAISLDSVEPAALPTMPQVVGAAMTGIDFSELDTKNDQDEALSTTPIEALDSDLAAAEQTERHQQNLYVCNFDTTDKLCMGATTWADSCGAGDMTCMSGATTDGMVVKENTCRSVRFLGTERPCVQGTAGISSYSIERMTWQGPNY